MKFHQLLLVLLLLVMLVPPLTSSARPSQQSSSGITIVIPSFEYYPRNDTASSGLDFHVFNTTSGANISSTALNCSIHVYNSSNNHITRATLVQDGNDDMEYNFPNNITGNRGFYQYIVWCNTTGGAYGWAESTFVMNYEGEGVIFDGGWQIATLIILLPIIFAFFIMKWSEDLGEEHFAMRFGLRMFAIFMLLMSIQAAYLAVLKYFIWQRMLDNLGIFTYIIGALLAILLFYFLIMYIKTMFDDIQRHKRREDE